MSDRINQPTATEVRGVRCSLVVIASMALTVIALDGEHFGGVRGQQEMAFRMQVSVPELTDLSKENKGVVDSYGPDVHRAGSFARNCLLARRMAERDVRFIQLFHRGWDHHTQLPANLRGQCRDVDQPIAALLKDLKQCGLLDDTLVEPDLRYEITAVCAGSRATIDAVCTRYRRHLSLVLVDSSPHGHSPDQLPGILELTADA